jgi:phage/plasmid-associated DNA primase
MQNADWVNTIDRQYACSVELSEYYKFINNSTAFYTYTQGEENFSVNDGKRWIKFNFNPEMVKGFFTLIDRCRRAKGEPLIMCVLERQAPHSGLYIDLDIETKNTKIAETFKETDFSRLGRLIVSHIKTNIEITSPVKTNLFFLVKPTLVKKPDDMWKYGIHILLPSMLFEKRLKQYLLKKMSEDERIKDFMRKHDVENIDKFFDTNSANVPAVLFGACSKQNMFKPYELRYAFEYSFDNDDEPPESAKIPIETLESKNLVSELALSNEIEPPLIPRKLFPANPSIASQLEKTPIVTEMVVDDTIKWDPECEIVHSLLDILPEKYYEDRNLWRNVVFALANSKKEFKQLAIDFSKKSKSKWDETAFNELWDYALSHTVPNPLTIRSIEYWAREHSKLMYDNVMKNNSRVLLRNYIFKSLGKLSNNQIAQLLSKIFATKFVTDVDPFLLRQDRYLWYEFVDYDDQREAGEIWKWRQVAVPEKISKYMSEELLQHVEEIRRELTTEVIDKSQELSELEIKTKKQIQKNLEHVKDELGSYQFKSHVIREAEMYFRRYNFISQIDKNGMLLGVGNGVLCLGKECKLINSHHEYILSLYTPVYYVPFNPMDEKIKKVMKAIEDIVYEPDAREWIMMFFAQCLDGERKEGIILLWEGSGQNGKTTLIQWVTKSLGKYASKLAMNLLTSDHETSDKPNSAAMRLKDLRFGYFEESRRGDKLNEARLKEVANPGFMTARDLHRKQEVFPVTCNCVATSQYPFIIDAVDHGTWRRIRHYQSKIQFKKDPDPAKPYEKKEDQDLIRRDDPDFQVAFLSVLTYYYEKLQKEYRGEIQNVPAPTIIKETEEFRSSRDSMHRYIRQNVVKSSCGNKYPLSYLVTRYIEWYAYNVDKNTPKIATIEQEFRNSLLSKYLSPLANGDYELVGCRIFAFSKDGGTVPDLHGGEEYLSSYITASAPTKNETGEVIMSSDETSEKTKDVTSEETKDVASEETKDVTSDATKDDADTQNIKIDELDWVIECFK